MDELFQITVKTLGGDSNNPVAVSKLREDMTIKTYFLKTLLKAPWQDDTFAMFFQTRPKQWDFDEATRSVKIHTELSDKIREAVVQKQKTAPFPEQLYTQVLKAGNPQEAVSVICCANDIQLGALPVDGIEALMGTLGHKDIPADIPVPSLNFAKCKLFAAVPSALVKKGSDLGRVLEFYMLVLKFGEGTDIDPSVQQQKIKSLKDLCELASRIISDKGLGTVGPKQMAPLCQTAPFHIVASAVAALGDKGGEDDALKQVASLLGKVPPNVLEGLAHDKLIQLAVCSTKSTVFAEATLGTVAKAAGATLAAWNMDDTAKLLLAISKAKAGTDSADVNGFYGRAAEAIAGKLPTISDTQLIKVVLSLGKIAAMKEFLEAAAAEAVNRLSKLPAPLLLMLTQGLLPLGGSNSSIEKVLETWAAMPDESKSQLKADQFAKLAQLVAPVAPSHEGFWKAVGGHLAAQLGSLTDAGKASIEAAFPDGNGPAFDGKEKVTDMLQRMKKNKERSSKDDRKRSRSRDRRDDRRDSDRRDRGGGSARLLASTGVLDKGDRGGDRRRSRSRSRRRR